MSNGNNYVVSICVNPISTKSHNSESKGTFFCSLGPSNFGHTDVYIFSELKLDENSFEANLLIKKSCHVNILVMIKYLLPFYTNLLVKSIAYFTPIFPSLNAGQFY